MRVSELVTMTPYDPYAQNQNPLPMMPPSVANETPRSGVPKVIGILMIIFGLLGVIAGFNGLLGGMSTFGIGHGGVLAMMQVSKLVGLAIAVFEVVAGVKLVNYRTSGPSFANIYAISNIATTLVFGLFTIAMLGGSFVGPAIVFGMLISVAWPVVVLALVNQPRARASCARTF